MAGCLNYWLGDFSIGAIAIHILYKATAVPRYGSLLKMVVTKKWNITLHEPKYVLVSSVLVAFAELRKAAVIYVMSVRPSAWNNSARTGRIFVKFDV